MGVVFKESEIVQRDREPTRRFFSDDEHFDLYVWYGDSSFAQIIGFQLGFRENPLNTDDEYIITHRPDMKKPDSVELGQISGHDQLHPATKTIHGTLNPPPEAFWRLFEIRLASLPKEIKTYLDPILTERKK